MKDMVRGRRVSAAEPATPPPLTLFNTPITVQKYYVVCFQQDCVIPCSKGIIQQDCYLFPKGAAFWCELTCSKKSWFKNVRT